MLEAVISYFSDIIHLLVLLEVIFIVLMMYWERTDPQKTIIWILLSIFMPIIGFVLYLFLGQSFYSKHAFRLKGIKDAQLAELYSVENRALNEDSREHPEMIWAFTMARSIQALGGDSYSRSNDIRLFTVGQDKFDSLFADLKAAKKFIHLEYYIIRNDELGNEFMRIITEKARSGVEVRLLTDAFGFGKGPHKAIKAFKDAGGRFATFHDVAVLILSPKKNNRNHRKIAVIDGEVGYCGGFNVGDEYLGKGKLGYWRDSAVRIYGESVMSLEARFQMDWDYASPYDVPDDKEKYFPISLDKKYGLFRAQVVSGGPDAAGRNPIQMQYLEMIRSAERTLYIHTPYLMPNQSVSDALKLAAASGVEVKIIIPDKPDHPFVFSNNISAANDLMKCGIKVYMYNRGFVHSKTMVVDGRICSVGSANLDDRSMVLNFETDTLVYSEEFGKQMNEAFRNDLAYCTEYTCKEYDKRTFSMKTAIVIAKFFRGIA
jgi:cardiolipin synthase